MWRYLGFQGEIITKASSKATNPLGSLIWEAAAFAKFFKNIILSRME